MQQGVQTKANAHAEPSAAKLPDVGLARRHEAGARMRSTVAPPDVSAWSRSRALLQRHGIVAQKKRPAIARRPSNQQFPGNQNFQSMLVYQKRPWMSYVPA